MTGVAAGLHAVVLLPPGTDEEAVVAAAAEREVEVAALASLYARSSPPDSGLVLGYAALTERAIAEGVRRLGEAACATRAPSVAAPARRR